MARVVDLDSNSTYGDMDCILYQTTVIFKKGRGSMYYITKHNKTLKVWTGKEFGIKGVPVMYETLNKAIRCVEKLIKKSTIYDPAQVEIIDRDNGIIHYISNNKWKKKINWEPGPARIIEWYSHGFTVSLIPKGKALQGIDVMIEYGRGERYHARNIEKAKELAVEKVKTYLKELLGIF